MNKLKQSLLLILAVSGLSATNILNAQTPGVWTGSSATTTTNDAVGVGTSAPEAHIEVKYCDDQEKGVIITKKDCGFYVLNPADINMTYDGVVHPFIPGEGSGGGGPVVFNSPTNFLLTPYQSFLAKPMLWARTENASLFRPQASGQHSTQFIVTPYGKTGINIENPRATLDVKGLGGRNVPAAIFGRQKLGTVDRTQHIHYVPLLGENGYNQISQKDDQGIFFTDGVGTNGANASGSFIIAPWVDGGDPAIGGIRVNQNGNLEVHGTVKATQLNLAAQWWSDFVFSDNYKLMPLNEVKAFIKMNKHLPNIPSENTVCEKGLDIGEMQALHMQKIEELTLYIIDQENKINKQSEAVKNLTDNNLKTAQLLKKQEELLKKQQNEIDVLKKQVATLMTK